MDYMYSITNQDYNSNHDNIDFTFIEEPTVVEILSITANIDCTV